MGKRKKLRADQIKEARKSIALASLKDVPTSPRKMRLVADAVRGKRVEIALYMLKHSPKEASRRLEKLLLSAISNWQAKNEGERLEDRNLIVKEISVDGGRMLKRVQPAPQGRAHRIRKRSNHVTIIVGDAMDTAGVQEINQDLN
jgi:large subunit ribosomal protein L22